MYHNNAGTPWDIPQAFLDQSAYTTETLEQSFYADDIVYSPPPPSNRVVVEVWEDNFEEEFERLVTSTDKYPIIAIDTEFPGTVTKPGVMPEAYAKIYNAPYYATAISVNATQLIQLGVTLYNEAGDCPSEVACWQFNFYFDIDYETHNVDSIKLLEKSYLNIRAHATAGIDHHRFAQLFMGSGLVMNPFLEWVTFHGGCDMAYLLKLVTGRPIPYFLVDFLKLMSIYFPVVFDIKHLLMLLEEKRGGLNSIAQQCGVERVGIQHQAGSDSMVTGDVFLHYRDRLYNNDFAREFGKLCPFAEIGYLYLKETGASYYPSESLNM